MKNLVNELLDLPFANLLAKEVKTALKKERQRRKNFFAHQYDKAEFINGELVIPSPLNKKAQSAKDSLVLELKNLLKNTDFEVFDEQCTVLSRNVYQSPICVFHKNKIKKIENEKFVFGTPTLVIEMTDHFSEYYIREIKKSDFEAHSVAEYWIIDAETQHIEQFFYKEGKYETFRKDDKLLKSKCFKNFEVSSKSIFNRPIKSQNNFVPKTDEKEFY